jgi:site-specific recombinase XerD
MTRPVRRSQHGDLSENTRRAYAVGWADFTAYCQARAFNSLPATPQTVALYVGHIAQRGVKVPTIRLYLAAVARSHKEAGLTPPTRHRVVRRMVRGVARAIGASPARKSVLTVDALRAMLAISDGSLKPTRDHAMILLGFATALRRSQLAALLVEDLRFCPEGVVVTVERVELVVPCANTSLCAVRALRAWLTASGVSSGPLFRSFTLARTMRETPISGRDVANVVKLLATKARLEGDFSANSLRAGRARRRAAHT